MGGLRAVLSFFGLQEKEPPPKDGLAHPFNKTCGLITTPQERGTGYLVTPDRVATCEHVVRGSDVVTIRFARRDGAIQQQATVLDRDQAADSALLALPEPITDAQPLGLGRCTFKQDWMGWGFPKDAGMSGIHLDGLVDDPDGSDDLDAPALQLSSLRIGVLKDERLHGFSGSPVVVSGMVVGHLKRILPVGASGSAAFSTVWATPAQYVQNLLDKKCVPPVAAPELPKTKQRDATRVFELWKNWKARGAGAGPPAITVAHILIQSGRPDLALQVLDAGGGNALRALQLRALAKARLGSVDEAIAILEKLHASGQLDAETGGLLGGRYKQKWMKQKSERPFLEKSFQTYADTFAATADAYPGINAAAMALWLGNTEESRNIARQVLDANELSGVPRDSMNQWELATQAEAYLLLGELDRAAEWYSLAVARNPMAIENIAVMRRQARTNLEKLLLPTDSLDSAFPIGRVAAFAGHMVDAPERATPRFPPAKEPAVRAAIRQRLERADVAYGFSSLARGSDILFVEELLARGGAVRVLLPFPRSDFEKASVGDAWSARFAALLDDDRVESEVLRDTAPSEKDQPDAFAECNRQILTKATSFAERMDEKPMLLAVWDGKPGDGRGGTADVIEQWQATKCEVDVINLTTL
jgi:tetratricopeptide (TPR) repeat protein